MDFVKRSEEQNYFISNENTRRFYILIEFNRFFFGYINGNLKIGKTFQSCDNIDLNRIFHFQFVSKVFRFLFTFLLFFFRKINKYCRLHPFVGFSGIQLIVLCDQIYFSFFQQFTRQHTISRARNLAC